MQISYINKGREYKLRRHKYIWMPENVSFVIPEVMSGVPEQRFESSELRPKIKFRLEKTEVDVDAGKLRVWYAIKSAKQFFKVSIRLVEPYVNNIKEIADEMSSVFLNLPEGIARGTNFKDVPGDIASKSVDGMVLYFPEPSRLTEETSKILVPEKNSEKEEKRVMGRKGKRNKPFDYWTFDQDGLNEGFVLNVGNEQAVEYIRRLEIGSLPEGKDVVSAYVRPCFCEEYDM